MCLYSVASILTIPVAVLVDWWLKNFILSWKALVGVGAILIGFVGLVVSEVRETKKKADKQKEKETEKLIPDESIDSSEEKLGAETEKERLISDKLKDKPGEKPRLRIN